jgi:NAD(P)-dependent dehydrogenase (short-subunit alcohol dehydrogenase family)
MLYWLDNERPARFTGIRCLKTKNNGEVPMLLKDKVAIITGGAKGMGKAMVLKFAEEGCAVAIADISIKEANETAEELSNQGKKALAIQCDVAKFDQVKATVEKVVAAFGKIDILVNNAGALLNRTPIEDMTEEEWDSMIALNLKSQFLFCKFVIPYMKAQKSGKILNFSSLGAIHPPDHLPHYHAAKGGVMSLTKDLAFTLAPFGIYVNSVLPGPIRTSFFDFHTSSMTDKEKDDFFTGFGKVAAPLGRVGYPHEIANAALFFCSDMSSYTTGETLLVSGGLPLPPKGEKL